MLTLTDQEMYDLIASSKVVYKQRVFSLDSQEYFYFNGIVFIGECSCRVIGSISKEQCSMPGNKYCAPINDATGIILSIG